MAIALLLSPLWARSGLYWFFWILLILTLGYIALVGILLVAENRLLFHPTRETEDWVKPPRGSVFVDIELVDARGNRLHAWWAKPKQWIPDQGAVLFFHGNAGNLSHRGELVEAWRDLLGMAVLIVDYPGYGRSKGKPSEEGCYAAGNAALEWLERVAMVNSKRVVLVGGSLGGAIAMDLGVRQKCAAVVLISSFTSFPDMAAKTFPMLPGRWLVRNQFNTRAKIGELKVPVFIAHSSNDELIPISQAESNFEAAREPKDFFRMSNWPHQDGLTPQAMKAVKNFLDNVLPWRKELDG